MFHYLFDNRYVPLTLELGFLECSVETAAANYLDWQSKIQSERGVTLSSEKKVGALDSLFEMLLPLTTIESRRFLFVPTQTKWTAFFENKSMGGDPASAVSFLAEKIGCRGVRAAVHPERDGKQKAHAASPPVGVLLELYAPQPVEILNTERSIYAVKDGEKWTFGAHGKQQDFEDTTAYKARKIIDRFTFDLLCTYLKHLGISAFDENFYLSTDENPAVLIEKHGSIAIGLKELALSEV